MIIELSRIFAEFDENQWEPYAQAVENLISAHASGWHAFSPSREVCQSLLANTRLSRTQQGVIKRIAEKASTLGGQALSSQKVMLCFPESAELRTFRQNQIAVRLLRFNILDNCSPSQLLTENSAIDGVFLEELCRLMSREIGHNASLKIQHVHGGGGTIGTQYKQACQEVRPTLCVVDSDRKYSDCALGSTARAVRANSGSEQCATTQFYVLPVRELENIVPVSALFDVYRESPEICQRVKKLCSYIERVRSERIIEADNILQYFDFKTGITRGHVAAVPQNRRGAFVRFAQVVSIQSQKDDFDNPGDESLIHAGISANMLYLTLQYLKDWTKDRQGFARRLKSSPNWPWLSDLLRLLAAYGVGGEKTASAS